MSFNVIKLGQLLATLTDYHANGAYKALKENVELLDTPDYALMIRTTNFENDDFTDSVKYISKSAYDFLSKSKVYPTDIIMNKIANAGSVYLMPDLSRPVSLAMNLFLLRVDNNKANPIYVYIFLKINESYVKQFANGSVTKTITKDAVRNLDIVLPPRTEQDKIARSYQIISNKINNNNKINQTLEQMAQALFKSWFVDFEPVKAKISVLEAGGSQEEATLAAMTAISGKDADALAVFEREHSEQYAELKATAELFPSAMQDSELGDIPEGWMVNPTSAHYNISIGKTPPRKEAQWFSTTDGDLKWVSIKDMGIASTYISETSERLTHEAVKKFNIKVMPADTVFLSFKLTVGRICITTEDMCSNEAIAHFTPKGNKYKSHWLYHALNSFDFNKLGSTSSIATAVNSKTIRDMKLIFPNELISQRYTEKVSCLMQLQKLNAGQINSLTQLRDTLLPKLLSGEITLPEAEQTVSEAENV
ncbi:restriction endonuclease subunit S [Citrobacter braakii]|uniref:restriction endonuclease subunit S n=1 Tax=Citrobacter braakii TaxID=57706 RepID=UPI00242AEA9C|nr:restriction endonuclease subunit S [Citrobacter braakii]WFW81723.1 restriction endonuclease subunit S [Citrobacter braakii]